MYRKAKEGYERAYGNSQHVDVLRACNNVGNVLRKQGKFVEAEPLLLQAFEGYKSSVGEHNLKTLRALENLGTLYENMGRFEDAEKMLKVAVEGYESQSSSDVSAEHPELIKALKTLVELYTKQGKGQEKKSVLKRAESFGVDQSRLLSTKR